MGYLIYQLKTEFFLAEPFHEKALAAVKKLVRAMIDANYRIAFVNAAEIEQAENLEEALSAFRWTPEVNETGDIIELDFTGEKAGDDHLLFIAVAAYVRSGSYISFIGEDSKVRRWLFTSGRVSQQTGSITFTDSNVSN